MRVLNVLQMYARSFFGGLIYSVFFRFGFLLTEMFEMRMCFFLRINMRIIMQWNAMALVYSNKR